MKEDKSLSGERLDLAFTKGSNMGMRLSVCGLVAACSQFCGTAIAAVAITTTGAGSSGGGLLLRDNPNPWWVQNTAEVQYCVSIREGAFTLQREVAERYIAEAFAFWQREFSKDTPFHNGDLEKPNDQIFVGTQRFLQVSCDQPVDLTFQLGYLTDEQRKSFDDPESVVAVAVRTNYDRKNLRGSGYIYVSPTQGQGKYEGFVQPYDPWLVGEGIFFYAMIVHELGHVFGVPHMSGAGSLMSETFVEDLVTMNAQWVEFVAGLMRVIGLPEVLKVTRSTDLTWCTGQREPSTLRSLHRGRDLREKVLGIPGGPEWKCSSISYEGGALRVRVGKSEDSLELVGEARMNVVEDDDYSDLVTLWLPPEHNDFFKLKAGAFVRRFTTARQRSVELKGEFELFATGQRTPIAFELVPGMAWPPRISAVVDGELVSNVLNGK